MIVRIDHDALAEIRAQTLYCLRQNPAAGKRLLAAFEKAVQEISVAPTTFPYMESIRHNRRFRRVVLKRFRIVIIYEIAEQEVLIVAVAHGSQRPGYWRYRLRR